MYDIEITYSTGNSFSTYKTQDLVDIPMANLEIAKENLQRIKQHWKIYRSKSAYSSHPGIFETKYPHFYIQETDGIVLMVDGCKIHEIQHPFWTGYFETLISAKIVQLDKDEMEFFV
jgi:hypothetical protein